jgi:WD40 repeat protein
MYAMTNAIDGGVMCWQLVPGAFIKIDLANIRDLEWDRKSCVFSWDSLGIWSKCCHDNKNLDQTLKEDDVNQVFLSPDKEILAVADNLGPVRLFNYPTYNQGQACLTLDLP